MTISGRLVFLPCFGRLLKKDWLKRASCWTRLEVEAEETRQVGAKLKDGWKETCFLCCSYAVGYTAGYTAGELSSFLVLFFRFGSQTEFRIFFFTWLVSSTFLTMSVGSVGVVLRLSCFHFLLHIYLLLPVLLSLVRQLYFFHPILSSFLRFTDQPLKLWLSFLLLSLIPVWVCFFFSCCSIHVQSFLSFSSLLFHVWLRLVFYFIYSSILSNPVSPALALLTTLSFREQKGKKADQLRRKKWWKPSDRFEKRM